MEKKVYELKISEVLEHVMPPLQEMELNLLTQSLLTEGCRDPLVVWDGTLIDGHNRYRICQEHQIPFSYIEMEFGDESEARKWIIRNQLARRNVPDFVRCELVLPLEAELKAEAKKRQGQRTDLQNLVPNLEQSDKPKRTLEQLADIAGVSKGTFDTAKKLMDRADEETKEKLRRGELSIHGASEEMKRKQGIQENEDGAPRIPQDKSQECSQGKKPGDIVPGFGVEQFMGPRQDGAIVRQPDSVYEIPPIEVYGNMPSDDMQLRGNAELVHARSDLQSSTDYYVRRAGEILHGMSAASISTENIQTLRDIVTNGYRQIMELLNQKLNGGNEDE